MNTLPLGLASWERTLQAVNKVRDRLLRKDRTHLRDMLDVGLIDENWTSHLPSELARRLQELLDDPDG